MSDLYKKLRNLVLSTTGCKVNNHAISIILAWQAARQAPASVEPVGYLMQSTYENQRDSLILCEEVEEGDRESDESNGWTYTPLYTHPPAKVPEGRVAIPRDVAEAHGMYLVGYSWLKHNAPDQLTTTATPATTPEAEHTERLKAVNKDQAQTISELDALVHAFRKSLRDLLPLVKLPPMGDPDREVCKEGLELAEDLISGAKIPAATPQPPVEQEGE